MDWQSAAIEYLEAITPALAFASIFGLLYVIGLKLDRISSQLETLDYRLRKQELERMRRSPKEGSQ